MDEIRRKWDIGNAAVEFIPYWENKEVTSKTPGSCISYYDKNGEKLVLVSNLARKDKKLIISLPAGTKTVIDAETGKEIPFSKNTVSVAIKRNDFGVLILKK